MERKTVMKQTKLILIVILIIIAAVLVIQNTKPVNTHILFFTITMPRAVLLLLMTLIGFVIGVFTVFHYIGKRNQREIKNGN